MFDLHTLNPPQRLAVETLNGPVLILAGAGTGKTRVITHRIAYLVRRKIAPENILAVTFTNKAAREMQERIRALLPKPLPAGPAADAPRSSATRRPTICTFHSLCVRILRRHIEKLGYKRDFVIYDEAEQLGAIRKILASVSTRGEKADPGAVLAWLSRFKNSGGRSIAGAASETQALAEHIAGRYASALRACNAVDFDDLILLTLRLFRDHPEALEACRQQYRYVMVDEYQDTNAAQFELVHALTRVHRNFCVVGDDDQSIYGWRGAEIANLLNLEEHFPEVKVIKLEQNYRSTTTILTAANALIQNNLRRRVKKLWSTKGTGKKISLRQFATDEEEARETVAAIEFQRLAHRTPWAQHAILFRTNQQSRPLETALRAAGVRYHLIGGQSFFDRREIRDLLAYLKTLLNPHDDISLLRIANTPARGLSDVTMERLLSASQERGTSVFATMKNPLVTSTLPSRTRNAMASFVQWVEQNQGDLQLAIPPASPCPDIPTRPGPPPPPPSLAAWTDHLLTGLGYYTELRRLEKEPETAENRVRNLKDFIATMEERETSAATLADRLLEFLETVTLDNDRDDEKENTGDAVTLITIHSCKGLEFPHVYLVGMEEGLLPHSRSKTEGTLDEERRLLYVAVTRAMTTLTMSHCAGRKKYGQLLPCHPSQFLKEFPPELIEVETEKNAKPVSQAAGKDLFAALRNAVR
ncbi:MAG TPA: UvrD-helicase domain-containing protein [Verrucomicrobiota bacterium]|nr:UvrD-helicase domain-containing protein [Verrucomicrobiota bacterium]HNT14612.1 UvrD-helicase domain-containing protein [Verrucomicrobiota bacterium]